MKAETRTFYEQAIDRAVEQIVRGLDEALELGSLARGAALSPLHFHRIFRGLVGETPLGLHRRLRLERAALQLTRGTSPVTRIALEAGYETHESFTRAFRDAYAASPSALRARARAALEAGAEGPAVELAARSGLHASGSGPPVTLHPEANAMHVEVLSLPLLQVVAVPHRGPYSAIGEAFARLDALVGPLGLEAEAVAMIALYHDDPESVPAAELRADAGLVVASELVLPEGLVALRIPEGRYARATHVGPYALLGDAWARLMGGWLPRSGHRLGPGPSYERYHNTPLTAPPDELRTDLYVSLAG
jgi:AraC family transcriptional regulator